MDGNIEGRQPSAPPAGRPALARAASPAAVSAASPQARPRRRRPVGLILFLVFLFVLLLHTLLDRLAPYTSEATLQAPVVGVAPNVSGTIVGVSVKDNQPVRTGDPLFQIDTSRFDTAVAQAEANLSNAVMAVGASTVALSAPAARVADAQAALANERAQFLRIQTLAGRGDSPRAQLDAEQAKLASAEAGCNPPRPGWRKRGGGWDPRAPTIRRSGLRWPSISARGSTSTTLPSRRRSTAW